MLPCRWPVLYWCLRCADFAAALRVASIYLGAQGTLNYRVCGSNHYHAPVQMARPLLVPSLS